MKIFDLLVINIGIVSLMVLTAYKYDLDKIYDSWRTTINSKILPTNFCLQCFATHLSLMVSATMVISLGFPMWYIIMLTLSTAPYVILLINKI
jgi:hypothetical protein